MSHLFCQNRHADRRKAMEELSFAEYLRKEIGLDDYQISKMQELLASFELKADTRAATEEVKVCPKCGADHSKVVRSGFAGSGKQMFRCASCGRRFSKDGSPRHKYGRGVVGCDIGTCVESRHFGEKDRQNSRRKSSRGET